VITIKELLGRKSSGTGLESRECGRRDPSRWSRGTLFSQKLALTSPITGGRSVGIVRSRTEATDVSFLDTTLFFSPPWFQYWPECHCHWRSCLCPRWLRYDGTILGRHTVASVAFFKPCHLPYSSMNFQVIFSFCRASPAQPFSDLSPTGLMSIFYCLYFWDSPNQDG
jgi:hypothetical protein